MAGVANVTIKASNQVLTRSWLGAFLVILVYYGQRNISYCTNKNFWGNWFMRSRPWMMNV